MEPLLLVAVPFTALIVFALVATYLLKSRGRVAVAILLVATWAVTSFTYLAIRDPAPYWEDSLTLKGDITFVISSGLSYIVAVLPVCLLSPTASIKRVLAISLSVSIIAACLFYPVYFILLCILRGTCDP